MRLALALAVVCLLPGGAAAQSIISPASVVGTGVASGDVLLRISGSCPSGYSEVTAARGYYLVGTPASGTVAGTLGTAHTDLANSSYTPSGTNGTSTVTPIGTNATSTVTPIGTVGTHSHTFTGSALATHAHSISTTTENTTLHASNRVYISSGITRVGDSSGAATSEGRIVTPGESVSAGTPAGTLDSVSGGTFTGSSSTVAAQTFTGSSSTVAAQTFTGTATTTMTGTIAPKYQILLCQKT